MPIDKLNPTAALIAALRAEASPKSERQGKKKAEKPLENFTRVGTQRDIAVLRRQLKEVVRTIDVSDADAVKAAKPKIVREILLWQFGGELREHPDWQPMLESILATLDSNANSTSQLAKLLAELKA